MPERAPFVPDTASKRSPIEPERNAQARNAPREKRARQRNRGASGTGISRRRMPARTQEYLRASGRGNSFCPMHRCRGQQGDAGAFPPLSTPEALGRASLAAIESIIRTLGLFRAKAKSLQRCAQQLADECNGEVPATMEELTRLAGVGRKTANVILGHAFARPAVAVDTHCRRVSRRLVLTRQQDPAKIEGDLGRILPPEEWTGFSHRLILHGRAVCHARKPACERCVLSELCPSKAIVRNSFDQQAHEIRDRREHF